MPATRPDEDWGVTRVSVSLAEHSGWVLLVEHDGQIVATEHHNDWHRVERRRRLLETKTPALFVDSGNVARRAADLNLARTGYGAGVRLHSGTATFARLDVAKGREGWRFDFRLNDPFRLGRLKQRTAAVPFVP